MNLLNFILLDFKFLMTWNGVVSSLVDWVRGSLANQSTCNLKGSRHVIG